MVIAKKTGERLQRRVLTLEYAKKTERMDGISVSLLTMQFDGRVNSESKVYDYLRKILKVITPRLMILP